MRQSRLSRSMVALAVHRAATVRRVMVRRLNSVLGLDESYRYGCARQIAPGASCRHLSIVPRRALPASARGGKDSALSTCRVPNLLGHGGSHLPLLGVIQN